MNWPIKLQAPSCKHLELDRSLDLGYCRIKKNETRTYAQLNASRPRAVVTRRKYCSRNCSALEATAPGHKFPFELKASSPKLTKVQATSFKLHDSRSTVHMKTIHGSWTEGLCYDKSIVWMLVMPSYLVWTKFKFVTLCYL